MSSINFPVVRLSVFFCCFFRLAYGTHTISCLPPNSGFAFRTQWLRYNNTVLVLLFQSGVPIHGSFSPHPDGRLSNGLSGSSMGGPSNSPSMTSSSQTLPIRHQQPPIGPPHSQTIARGPYGRSASNARKLSTIAAPKEGFVAYGKRCTEFKQLFDLHRRLQPINQPEDL